MSDTTKIPLFHKPQPVEINSESEGYMTFACKCGRTWQELIPLPMLCHVLAKRVKDLQCPACGIATGVFFVIEPEK